MNTVSDTHASGTMLHRFEAAGLGQAPFLCIGVSENMWSPCPGEPARPGGACDYCGQGIRYEYMVKDVEGKRFKVGGDCIRKVGDTGLLKTVKTEERKRRFEKAKLERIRYRTILDKALAHPLTRDLLAEHQHPRGFDGNTMLQHVEFMRLHAGLTGLKATAKILANLLA